MDSPFGCPRHVRPCGIRYFRQISTGFLVHYEIAALCGGDNENEKFHVALTHVSRKKYTIFFELPSQHFGR